MTLVEQLKQSSCLDPEQSYISERESEFLRERFQRYLQSALITGNPAHVQTIEKLMMVVQDICAGNKTLDDFDVVQDQVIDLREYEFLRTAVDGMTGWNFLRFLADPKGKMEKIQTFHRLRYG